MKRLPQHNHSDVCTHDNSNHGNELLDNYVYEADLLTRQSPGYSCEAAHPGSGKRRLLVTRQWQSALSVVGLPVSNLHSSLIRNGLPLFP